MSFIESIRTSTEEEIYVLSKNGSWKRAKYTTNFSDLSKLVDHINDHGRRSIDEIKIIETGLEGEGVSTVILKPSSRSRADCTYLLASLRSRLPNRSIVSCRIFKNDKVEKLIIAIY